MSEAAEALRWQERIEATIRRYGLEPIDASGNESGDPLDWSADQISAALRSTTEERDEATRERDELVSRLRTSTGLLGAASAVGNAMLTKLDAAEARVSRLRATLEGFAEADCEYGDGCPKFAGSRHGRCVPCRARDALGAP